MAPATTRSLQYFLMNRTLILLSAIVAVAAAGIAGFLLAKPGDTSARLAAQDRITSLEEELHDARAEIATLKSKLAKPTPAPSATPSVAAATPAADKAKVPEVTPTKPAEAGAPESPMKAWKKMMETPGMKDMMKQQQLSQIETGYGRLFEDLHLNAEEKEQFKQLIAARLTSATELSFKLMDAGSNPEALKQLKDQITQSNATYDKAIHDFLDNEGDYKTYQYWEETQPERMQLNMMGRQAFVSAGEPLSVDQENQLIGVMADVRKTQSTLPDMTKPQNFDPAMMTDEMMQKLLDQMDAQSKAVADRSSAFLSPTQQQALVKMQQQSRSMAEMGFKMSATMFGKKTN